MNSRLKPVVPVLCWILTTAGHAAAQTTKLLPVDEAAEQPGFFTFRASLLRAAESRDTAFLYSAIAPDILNSFGGNGGLAEFKQIWRPAEPDSELWALLTDILALGGSFQGDTLFAAPYTYSAFPEELDSFQYVVIVGANVRVRAQPNLDASVLATLSFAVVRETTRDPSVAREGWRAVELSSGRTGFVSEKYVRSPLGYRAVFERRAGVWLLRSLVAGD